MTEVAAVILRDDAGRILICRRGPGGNCPYLWEFPGGKCEPGEDHAACAVRECMEELGVQVELGAVYGRTAYAYPDKELFFTFFEGKISSGTLTMHVHTGLCWVTPGELGDFSFCPADEPLIAQLKAEG